MPSSMTLRKRARESVEVSDDSLDVEIETPSTSKRSRMNRSTSARRSTKPVAVNSEVVSKEEVEDLREAVAAAKKRIEDLESTLDFKTRETVVLKGAIRARDEGLNILDKARQDAKRQVEDLESALDFRRREKMVFEGAIQMQSNKLKMLDKARQEDLSKFEEALSCANCTEWLWHPKILKCGHVLCETCIYKWFDAKRPSPDCPNCRTPITINDKPSEDYLVKNLVQNLYDVKTRLGVEAEADPGVNETARRALERWNFFTPPGVVEANVAGVHHRMRILRPPNVDYEQPQIRVHDDYLLPPHPRHVHDPRQPRYIPVPQADALGHHAPPPGPNLQRFLVNRPHIVEPASYPIGPPHAYAAPPPPPPIPVRNVVAVQHRERQRRRIVRSAELQAFDAQQDRAFARNQDRIARMQG